ncbi:MAG: HNH endonuclease [Bacteroidetes bacterium]|nr:HNH endonuclease [Bacteroidota bacterium]
MIDDFGNLVLVSRGINSEYGNKNFIVKQSEFKLKPNFDSLKSALVFEHESWNDELCSKHREKMKQYLIKYFEID